MEPNPETFRAKPKAIMRLWLVERSDENEIRAGDFTKFIIAAPDPYLAMRRHPDGVRRWDSLNRRGFVKDVVINAKSPTEPSMPADSWTKELGNINVTYIGKAADKFNEFDIVCTERATWMGSV